MKPPLRAHGDDEKKSSATIEAKPKIKSGMGDVTRFTPTAIKIKRITQQKGRLKPTGMALSVCVCVCLFMRACMCVCLYGCVTCLCVCLLLAYLLVGSNFCDKPLVVFLCLPFCSHAR